jgi:hypothetical protein
MSSNFQKKANSLPSPDPQPEAKAKPDNATCNKAAHPRRGRIRMMRTASTRRLLQ